MMMGRFSVFLLCLLLGAALAEAPPETCPSDDDDSCSSVPKKEEECDDSVKECNYWAQMGECDNNPYYMKATCPKSCKVCQPGKSLNEIMEETDRQVQQEQLNSTPWGIKQVTIAEVNPRLDLIDATQKVIDETQHYMEQTVYATNDYLVVKDRCKNRNAHCALWTVLGECDANKRFMHSECAPSCQVCHLLDQLTRCPINETIPEAFKKGDIDLMFQRIVRENAATVHSMPQPVSDDIPDGPWVVTLENFLSPLECQTLIELGAKEGYARSMAVGDVGHDGRTQPVEDEGRTSTNAWCKATGTECASNATVKAVSQRMATLTGIPSDNQEWLQLLRYQEGQFYKEHHDYIPQHLERQQGVRMVTVFLYLSNVEQGGGTNFPQLSHNLTISPSIGKALIWASVKNKDPNMKDYRTAHRALPVEKGLKYAANAWIHQRDFKEAFARDCA